MQRDRKRPGGLGESCQGLAIQPAIRQRHADHDTRQPGGPDRRDIGQHRVQISVPKTKITSSWPDYPMAGHARSGTRRNQPRPRRQPAQPKPGTELDPVRAAGDGSLDPGRTVHTDFEQWQNSALFRSAQVLADLGPKIHHIATIIFVQLKFQRPLLLLDKHLDPGSPATQP